MRKRIALLLLVIYCIILLSFGLFGEQLQKLSFPNVETAHPSYGVIGSNTDTYYPCIIPACAITEPETVYLAVPVHEKWGDRIIADQLPIHILASDADKAAIDTVLPEDTAVIISSTAPLADSMTVYMIQK